MVDQLPTVGGDAGPREVVPVMLFGADGLQYVAIPPDIFTDDNGPNRRLRVDPGQTGFFAKREFRIFHEFSSTTGAGAAAIPANQRMMIRVVTTQDIILKGLSLVIDNGQIRMSIYRGGTPTGTFGTTITPIATNTMANEGPAQVATTTTVARTDAGNAAAVSLTGGALTDAYRLKVENQTGAASTTQGTQDSERGIAANTFYLLIENIGAGIAEGVIYARWEERA